MTLIDVAQRAGVVTMTVSRALTRPEMVSETLRAKILKAIDELGYVQNRFASALASGTSRIIPVIIPTLLHPVYIPMLEGINSTLTQNGYQTILGTTDYLINLEEKLVATFLGCSPGGFILSGVDHSSKTIKLLQRAHLPLVEVMDLTDHPIAMNVGFSHYEVGVAVARYFYQKGYQRIAYAGTLTEIDLRSVKRIAGFQQALKDYGLPFHFIQRSNEPFSISLGAKLLGELLRQYPLLPVFDGMSLGKVLSSPLLRALETARLAGLGARVELCADLMEWDYGDYEGITTKQIQEKVPGWTIWTHPCPGGETANKLGSEPIE